MKNSNALISMAQVSENANNPFATFCEYIKYVLVSENSQFVDFVSLKESVSTESGIRIPNNIMIQCLNQLQREGFINQCDHQIQVVGTYDTASYEQSRSIYRNQEQAVVNALISFAKGKDREWDFDFARNQLIYVLDNGGLAHDIFYNDTNFDTLIEDDSDDNITNESETDNPAIPIYSDRNIVARFISGLKTSNTIEWEYLKRIVEGLMICIGAYQLPDASFSSTTPQIANTPFIFDTRLILRYVGCADEATCAATQELISMIQKADGLVYYFPHTYEEVECAFDDAIHSLENKNPPSDHEMRIYCSKIDNNVAVLRAKKAGLKAELLASRIWEKPITNHDEQDRISFSFQQSVLVDYMRKNLRWESQTIKNDAISIWETHMCRRGNYCEYCGTHNRLCVFVTSNTKLISIALAFHKDHPEIQSISGWKPNRLPIITDTRLTCRLWSPAIQGERFAILRMTANVVAALKPTPQYINRIRRVSIELGKQVPEFSKIQLPEFFDDQMSDAVFENAKGPTDEIDIGHLATTISELIDYKMQDTIMKNNELSEQLGTKETEYDDQTQKIIDGAVQANISRVGFLNKTCLYLSIHWASTVFVLFASIAAFCSGKIVSMNTIYIAIILGLVKFLELLSASYYIQKKLLSFMLPFIEGRITSRIIRNTRQAEKKYQNTIIQRVINEQPLLEKCHKILHNEIG